MQRGLDGVPGHPFVQYFCTEKALPGRGVCVCFEELTICLLSPCVCCADIFASGAILFTQTHVRQVTVARSQLFRAECALQGGAGVEEHNLGQ